MEEYSFSGARVTFQFIEKASVNECFGVSEKLTKIPYKTCRLLILLDAFWGEDSQRYQKQQGSHYKVNASYNFAKHRKTVS